MTLSISLSENCNEDEAKKLQEQVLACTDDAITINAHTVERVNTLFAQALIASDIHCKQKNISFSIVSPSEGFNQAFSCIGAKALLDEWQNQGKETA